MSKRIFAVLLCCALSLCIFCGCGNQTNETIVDSDESRLVGNSEKTNADMQEAISLSEKKETSEHTDSNSTLNDLLDKIVSDNELSIIIGMKIDDIDILREKSGEIGNFQCRLNNDHQILSIATIDGKLLIYDISPCSQVNAVIENLILDQWSYEAEYYWYSESDDDEVELYQSAVFVKDNYEYVITMNTETDYDKIYSIELIDRDLLNGDQIDEKHDTAFAILHNLS